MVLQSVVESASRSAPALRFPADFVWGTSTSSFQIEGATGADGRGESIWDRFCAQPGTISDGTDGGPGCAHYERWEDDVRLLAQLGIGAYRFSIAWPRVLPAGRGRVETRGLDFYDRLVDGLLSVGVTPCPTLYHWDLPQALEDEGGWVNRATAEAFADYASVVVERLGDRIGTWATLNEPFVSSYFGYVTGDHAPGRRSWTDGFAAAHHLLVAHGLAGARIRELAPHARLAISLNFTPVTPLSDDEPDVARARVIDALHNHWFASPLSGKGYPAALTETLGWRQDEVLDGDMELIARPIDQLGVNFYTRQVVGREEPTRVPEGAPTTAMGWEVHPPALPQLLSTLHATYDFPSYVVTENGAAFADDQRVDGHVADDDRIAYLQAHLLEVHRAISDGVPLNGYFVWSLLDNFEWALGYSKTFGIVEVDRHTMQRRPKRSAGWYAHVIADNAVPVVGVTGDATGGVAQ
jgi:beta-glucosidase